jgi:hypothetical protein
MIIYRSFYTIAYLGCPLGFQAFARGRRGCGPQATGSPTSIVCRSYALSQRAAPGSCTQSCCSAKHSDQNPTNEQNVSIYPFCCLCWLRASYCLATAAQIPAEQKNGLSAPRDWELRVRCPSPGPSRAGSQALCLVLGAYQFVDMLA